MLLMPSILICIIEGFVPATEILPDASVCTPGWVVRVDIGLVEPLLRVAIAMGKVPPAPGPSWSQRCLETSVSIAAASDWTFTL